MWIMAGTLAWVQLIAYGKLEISTTIVFRFAPYTSFISSSCSSVIDSLSTASRPSLGDETLAQGMLYPPLGWLPTQTMATSDSRAARTASSLLLLAACLMLTPAPTFFLIPSTGGT